MSNELEEKFVSDDGISTVEGPVTPAGGAMKKKRADLHKSVHPTADKIKTPTPGQGAVKEEAEVEDDVEEIVEIDESIESIFEGMDLSEEFKNKVTLVFEAAVNEAATKKAELVIAEVTEALETEMQEAVESAIDEIVENLDSYLDYVVEEWMIENEVAIETGIKVEMAESLMAGLKSLFEEHNIDIDEDTIDVVAGLEEELEEIKATANEVIVENLALSKIISNLEAEKIFEEMTADLTITQRERLKVLSEKLDIEDLEEYSSDLETLKESFFSKKKALTESNTDEEEIITEEATTKKPVSDHFTVNALVEALNSRSNKK
jgi:hypothetical protein